MKTIRELFDTFIGINGKKRTDFSDFEKFCEKTFKEEGEALQTEALKNYTPDYTKQWDMQATDLDSPSFIFRRHYVERMTELQEFYKIAFIKGEI